MELFSVKEETANVPIQQMITGTPAFKPCMVWQIQICTGSSSSHEGFLIHVGVCIDLCPTWKRTILPIFTRHMHKVPKHLHLDFWFYFSHLLFLLVISLAISCWCPHIQFWFTMDNFLSSQNSMSYSPAAFYFPRMNFPTIFVSTLFPAFMFQSPLIISALFVWVYDQFLPWYLHKSFLGLHLQHL